MKSFKKLLIVIIMGIMLFGCDEVTDVDKIDDVLADQLAREAFDLLNDKLLDLEEPVGTPQQGEDLFPEADYNKIKAGFEAALTEAPDNALANFGMAILELASINYDEDLWTLIDDFDSEFSEGRLFNNQFSFLVNTPLMYVKYLQNSMRAGDISFARIQNYIDNNVMPKIENSLNSLEVAVSLPDSVVIKINTGEEVLELDKGELYAFRAGIFAVSAAMRMITLYDLDLFDENKTYDWLDEISFNGDYNEIESYTYEPVGQILTLEYQDNSVENDSLLFHILKYNIADRPGFGTFRSGNLPNEIKSDLEAILYDLQNVVDYVSSETDDQSDDIIKFDDITQLNNDINNIQDAPNFASDWQTVDDIISWVETLLDGPVTFNEDLHGDGIQVELTIDFSRMFNPGLQNMKDYLPLHNWLPEEDWVNEDYWEDEQYWGGGTYSFYFQEQLIHVDSVMTVESHYYDSWVEPLELVDETGTAIDVENEMPYFPDYTLNGIFPGMDRDKWFDLLGIDK